MSIKWAINTFDIIDSTQTMLKDMVLNDDSHEEGFVVSAERQSSGRARHGRTWEQGEGNLYLSFLITPNCTPQQIGQLSLLTGLAVNKTIHDHASNIDTRLKWPNDILINDLKCCGILIETLQSNEDIIQKLGIGIGINLASSPIEGSTNISCYTVDKINKSEFQNRLLNNFSDYYTLWQDYGFEKFLHEWLSFSYKKGTDVSVKSGSSKVTGKFETIDPDGNLMIVCNESLKLRKITSGEVFVL